MEKKLKIITLSVLALILVFTVVFIAVKKSPTPLAELEEGYEFVAPDGFTATVTLTVGETEFKIFIDNDENVLAIDATTDIGRRIANSIDFEELTLDAVVRELIRISNEQGIISDDSPILLNMETLDGCTLSPGEVMDKINATVKDMSEVKEHGINVPYFEDLSHEGEEELPSENMKTCPDCSGSGILHCSACADTGKIKCKKCSGTGYEEADCPSCSGSGKCFACSGTGKEIEEFDRTTNTNTCPECLGTGKCASCFGEGHRKCSACNEPESRTNSETAGEQICPSCNGNAGGDCPTCQGAGKVAE